MADDKMRLGAEVTDGFSGPLNKMRAMIASVAGETTRHGKAIRDSFDAVHGAVGKATSAVQSMAPSMATIGVGAVAATGAVTGLAAAIKSFGTSSASLAIASSNTGLAIQSLREFRALGERFGLSADTMGGAAHNFAKSFGQLKKGYGEMLGFLQAQGQPGIELAERMRKAASPDEALKIATEFFERLPKGLDREKLAERMFGSGDLGVLGSRLLGPIRKLWADIGKELGQLPPGAEKNALEFQRNFAGVIQQFETLRDTIGNQLIPPITEALGKLNAALADPATRKAIEEGVVPIVEKMRELLDRDWSQSGEKISRTLKTVGDVAYYLGLGLEKVVGGLEKVDQFGERHGLTSANTSSAKRARIGQLDKDIPEMERQAQNAWFSSQRDMLWNTVDAMKKERDDLQKQLGEKSKDGTREGAKQGILEGLREGIPQVQQQSYENGSGLGGLIHRASYGGLPGFGGSVPGAGSAAGGRGYRGGHGGEGDGRGGGYTPSGPQVAPRVFGGPGGAPGGVPGGGDLPGGEGPSMPGRPGKPWPRIPHAGRFGGIVTGPSAPAWKGPIEALPGEAGVGGGATPVTGSKAGRMKAVYEAFRSAGFNHGAAKSFTAEIGRENDFNANLMYGSHTDPHNRVRNSGMMSWQGSRSTALLEHLRQGGHLNPDGSIKRTQEALNAQAEFAKMEMNDPRVLKHGRRALSILDDPNSTHAQRALTLGDDVIKWRQHDPRYAHHAIKRDRYYAQMEAISQSGSAPAGNEFGPNAGEDFDAARRFHASKGGPLDRFKFPYDRRAGTLLSSLRRTPTESIRNPLKDVMKARAEAAATRGDPFEDGRAMKMVRDFNGNAGSMKAEGSVNVTLSPGMGPVNASAKLSGDLFQRVDIDRGKTMPRASTRD